MADLAPGSSLGGYRIEKLLGRGAMGSVYAARSPSGDAVALKVIAGDAAHDAAYVQRFRREALAAHVVDHPNAARCFAAGEDRGTHFLAMELVEGDALDVRVRREGKLPWREAARLGAQIARALAAIHEAGLVHRDLKPANVLVDGEGVAKVTDFGVARRAGSGTLTNTGEIVGTPDFMAPEQALAAKKVDGQADLYSLGALLFCLVTGEPPFKGTAYIVLQRHATATPPRVSSVVRDVPAALDALVARLLAKDPDARGSVVATAEALEALATSEERRKLPVGALAALGAVVVAVVVAVVAPRAVGLGAPATPSVPATPPPFVPAPAPVASVTAPPPPTTPSTNGDASVPAWYFELPEAERPTLPLPPAVRFFKKKGYYVLARDPMLLLAYVPPGTFEMGSPDFADAPVHTVELSGFFVGRLEVTYGQFRRFARTLEQPLIQGEPHDCGSSQQDASLDWERPSKDGHFPVSDIFPVVQLTWEHARAYARWLDADLPTEAQWERAAAWDPETRTSRRFPWGDEMPAAGSPRFANLIDQTLLQLNATANVVFPGYVDGFPYTSAVGSFPMDRSPSGLSDVLGNVRELCRDVYDPKYYERSPRVDPVNEGAPEDKELSHVARGGSWGLHTATVGLQERTAKGARWSSNCVGLRIAVSTTPSPR